ncbi:MAG: hypothetical protein ACRDHP_04920 [Ktedonobacterales bacterium]
MRKWQRLVPHSYWLMASAALLLIVIGVKLLDLWRNNLIGDWALFLYGLVTVVLGAIFVMTLVTYRRDQL